MASYSQELKSSIITRLITGETSTSDLAIETTGIGMEKCLYTSKSRCCKGNFKTKPGTKEIRKRNTNLAQELNKKEISVSDCEHAVKLINIAIGSDARLWMACKKLGISNKTINRWEETDSDLLI